MSDVPHRTVLLADGSEEHRGPLEQALNEAGFGVTAVTSGADAIEALQRGAFDVVVTDVWMPGTDGIGVIQSARRLSPLAAIFVVTGGGPGMSIASAAALASVWGAYRVYVRPFDIGELLREILALFPSL